MSEATPPVCRAFRAKHWAVSKDEAEAMIRTCWVLESNRRISANQPLDGPCLETVIIETINVPERQRRQGRAKALIAAVVGEAKEVGAKLVIVEGVGNPILADALARWGWDCDCGVSDFYMSVA